MKQTREKLLSPIVAAVLLIALVATPALAYFTSSDWASGGVRIKGPDTTITEKVGAGQKDVTVVNNADSVPVWVRARAYGASELSPQVVSGADDDGTALWSDTGNGWWTYRDIVEPGASTVAPLVVKIEWPFTAEDVAEDGTIVSTNGTDVGGETGGTSYVTVGTARGTNYNIVVVYEVKPVKYDVDGNALPAEWA